MKQIMMGIEQDIKVDMLLITDSEVKENKDGVYIIEYTYRQLKMETESALYSSVIDTENGENFESDLMKVIIGKPFFAKISTDGVVQDVYGMDRIFEDFQMDIDLDSATLADFRRSLQGSFGKESFTQTLQQLFVYYPDSGVKKDDVWTYNYESEAANMKVFLDNTVKLKNMDKKEILLQLSSKIKSLGDEMVDINGYPGNINLNGYALSELIIDPFTGLNKEAFLTQELKGNISFEDTNTRELIKIPTTILLKSSSFTKIR
jgi:hypothetical protein